MSDMPKSDMAARKPKTDIKGFMHEMDAKQCTEFDENASQTKPVVSRDWLVSVGKQSG